MNNPFHDFLINVINQIDGNDADKADLYEELLIHLQLTSDNFIQKGYDEKQAVQIAKELFGESNKIGQVMQEAMFPKRKILLLLLSFISMSYSVFVYLIHLVFEANASITWLLFSIGSSSILLVFALPILTTINRKSWLNTHLIIHTFIYLYGALFAASITHSISIFLSFFAYSIILLSVSMIYRTTIFDFQYSHSHVTRQEKQLHFINITVGIIIVGYSLFFLSSILIFSDGLSPFMLLILIPTTIWVLLYILQIQLVGRTKIKTAYGIAVIPFSLILIIVIWTIWSSV